MISIIIPVYNAEKYLVECIESVIKQSSSEWELILVDDGSTDKSSKICDMYADSNQRIRVIHKSNEGVSKARKTGCKEAKGDYVMFIDSDDLINEICIEKMAKILSNVEVDIIKFGILWERKDGSVEKSHLNHVGLYEKEKIEERIYPYLVHNWRAEYYAPSIWGGIFRRNIIFPYMIEDRMAAIGEDSACVIPAVYHCSKIYFLDENLYFYRYNNQSATRSRKIFNWDNPRIIAEHLMKNLDAEKYDFKQQIYRRITHDVFNVCLTQFNRNDSYEKIKEDILTHLDKPLYKESISQARFKFGSFAWYMVLALKYKNVWIMKQVSKWRNL